MDFYDNRTPINQSLPTTVGSVVLYEGHPFVMDLAGRTSHWIGRNRDLFLSAMTTREIEAYNPKVIWRAPASLDNLEAFVDEAPEPVQTYVWVVWNWSDGLNVVAAFPDNQELEALRFANQPGMDYRTTRVPAGVELRDSLK